jgi:hypothetical protein
VPATPPFALPAANAGAAPALGVPPALVAPLALGEPPVFAAAAAFGESAAPSEPPTLREPPMLAAPPECTLPFESFGKSSSAVRPPHAAAIRTLSTTHERIPCMLVMLRATERPVQGTANQASHGRSLPLGMVRAGLPITFRLRARRARWRR